MRITGLCKHLESYHQSEYLRLCEEHGWTMMLPKLRAEKALLAEHARPAYSQEKFLEALVRFIVTDNQVSTPL